MRRVSPEEIEGVRRLLSERPLGGLRPVEIPRAVLDRLAQALFDLAELQETSGALVSELLQSASRCEYHDGCTALATQFFAWEGDSECLCDGHAKIILGLDPDEQPLKTADLAYAPTLRRLRALLEAKP